MPRLIDDFVLAKLGVDRYLVDYDRWYRLSGKMDLVCAMYGIDTISLLVSFSNHESIREKGQASQ